MKYLLIDADILVYRAGFAVQKKGVISPVSHALRAVKTMLQKIHRGYHESEFGEPLEQYQTRLFLTASNKSNYRFALAKSVPYKYSRTKRDKPVHYQAIRDYLINYHNAEVIEGMEADDALSIACTADRDNTVIATNDKDLDNTPGYHYNFVKDEFYYQNGTQAYKSFVKQLLMGDVNDDIPGLPGIGAIYAQRIVDACGSNLDLMLQTAYDLYIHLKDEDYFIEQGSLVWILRDEGVPWAPDLKNLRKHKLRVSVDGGVLSKEMSPIKLGKMATWSVMSRLK